MGAAVEEEHLLSFVNLCDKVILAKENEDHNDDVGPLISVDEDNDVEVDYDFHNDGAFVQIELGLREEDIADMKGLSQIRPTLQGDRRHKLDQF